LLWYIREVSGHSREPWPLWWANASLVLHLNCVISLQKDSVLMELQHEVTTTDACCGLGKYGGLFICVLPQMTCSDASSHVWWDEFQWTCRRWWNWRSGTVLNLLCRYLLNFCVFALTNKFCEAEQWNVYLESHEVQ
jgi:hypothetical protein